MKKLFAFLTFVVLTFAQIEGAIWNEYALGGESQTAFVKFPSKPYSYSRLSQITFFCWDDTYNYNLTTSLYPLIINDPDEFITTYFDYVSEGKDVIKKIERCEYLGYPAVEIHRVEIIGSTLYDEIFERLIVTESNFYLLETSISHDKDTTDLESAFLKYAESLRLESQ